MNWLAAFAHQVRFDARRARWWLIGSAVAVLAVALVSSTPSFTLPPLVPFDALSWIAIVLGAAIVVLQDTPARPDGFLVGKPVAASVRFASALALALAGLLGPAAAWAWLRLVTFDVPLGAATAVTAAAAGRATLMVLPVMTMAAFAESLGGLLGRGLAVLVAAGLASAYLAWDGPPLSQEAWRAGTVATSAMLAVCLLYAYRGRWPRGIGSALAMLATLGLVTISLRRPRDVTAADAAPAPRGLSLVIDSLAVGLESMDATDPVSRLGVVPFRLWVRVEGAPPGAIVEVDAVHLALERADGTTLVPRLLEANGLFGGEVVGAFRWNGIAPPAMARTSLTVMVRDTAAALAVQDHVLGRPGGRLVRGTLSANLRVLRPRILTRQFGAPGQWRAPGERIAVRPAEDTSGASLVLDRREITGWVARPIATLDLAWLPDQPGFVEPDNTFAWAESADGREAVWITSVDRQRVVSLLPGLEVLFQRRTLTPHASSGLAARDPWFTGARLHVRRWERGGTMRVTADVSRIVSRIVSQAQETTSR